MFVYLRLLKLLFFSKFRTHLIKADEAAITKLRVWPHELDFNMHMNNACYFSIMDVGRFDFMIQTGIFFKVLKSGWLPMVGEAQISYFRPLKPFQKYELRTSLVSWDEKWFVMSQDFYADGKVAAKALIRGVLRKGKVNVKPSKILALIPDSNAPELKPPHGAIAFWLPFVKEVRDKN